MGKLSIKNLPKSFDLIRVDTLGFTCIVKVKKSDFIIRPDEDDEDEMHFVYPNDKLKMYPWGDQVDDIEFRIENDGDTLIPETSQYIYDLPESFDEDGYWNRFFLNKSEALEHVQKRIQSLQSSCDKLKE